MPQRVALTRCARLPGVSGVETPRRIAAQYLAIADRLLPDRIVGFYLVGSTALGAYRDGRSDIDFVAVLDRRLSDGELRRIRLVQLASGLRTSPRALRHGHVAMPGTVNGSYVTADDLTLPVTSIRPVASHYGAAFNKDAAFDVNPVVWKELSERGVVLRGAPPADLRLDPEPTHLRQWNLDNLSRYWRRWAEATMKGLRANSRMLPTGWVVAWGALGAPRLHHTIATGEIISKETAGEYALETFDHSWRALIEEALAFQRCELTRTSGSRTERIARAGEFVLEVIRSAEELGP